jgi:photosystem II stability/assembly factor-like uncharacterized protein
VSDHEDSLAIGALAVMPGNSGDTIYAGTGEANLAFLRQVTRNDRPLAGHRGMGVLKSTDSGVTWSVIRGEFEGHAFASLEISPFTSSTLVAATTAGLFRSQNNAITWTRLTGGLPTTVPDAMATSFAFHPLDRNVAYAAFWGQGLYKTSDFNAVQPNWTRLSGGLPLSALGRVGVATSPATPDRVYVLASNADHRLRGFWISLDAGSTWRLEKTAPDLLQGQGFFNLALFAHPDDAGVVFVGGSGDRRAHPSSLYRGRCEPQRCVFEPVGSSIHIDLHTLAANTENTDEMLAGSDGGIWHSLNEGQTWAPLNKGLVIGQYYQIALHPTRTDFLVAGSQDNGTHIYHGRPSWEHADDGDGGFVAIDHANPNVVINEFSSYKLARSRESGRYGTFVPIAPNPRSGRSVLLAPFAVDPEHGGTIALGLERIYLSDDGEEWMPITEDLTDYGHAPDESRPRLTRAVSAIAFASSNLMYAGTSDGLVWRVSKKDRWSARQLRAAGGGQLALANQYVTDIAVGRDAETVYVGYDGDRCPCLWRVASESAVWMPAAGSLNKLPGSVFAVEIHPFHDDIIYAGTANGVWRSTDAGVSWNRYGQGLPNTAIFDLKTHRNPPLLRAATHGRGIWEHSIAER